MRLTRLALAAIVTGTALWPATTDSSLPNVLVITVDTLQANHLSCYGYSRKTSPYMDGLARDGTRFSRAYTAIPLTGPAHIALFSGRYPQETGVRRNGVAPADNRTVVTLPQILRGHGYQTGAFISAWPLLGRLTHLDRYFGSYDETLTRTYQIFNSSRYAEDVTPPALNWLHKHANKKKPFFLWVHYFDPHEPYIFRADFEPAKIASVDSNEPAQPPDMRERVRSYDSEIYYTDHHIGKLLQALDDMHIRDSTIVVLVGDHGESLGHHGYVGHGRHVYESIIHVPFIIRYPGHVKAGQVFDTPVSLIDVTPTIVDLTVKNVAAAKKKAPVVFSGRSLAPSLEDGQHPTDRWIYCVTFPGKKGYAPQWLSWIWVKDEELPLRLGRIDHFSKMIWDPDGKKLSLYDLRSDPREDHPRVIADSTPTYQTDTSELKKWFSRTETRAQEQTLSAHDKEVLKSLGYVQ